ncbi:MAG: hypothetical protein QOE51_4437, partial [Actinoplanes sp.]|nr:hypothetical protein [Actinoplanes sp.]
MALTTLDPKTALVVIDLQKGVVDLLTAPYPAADVVARTAELANAFRAAGAPVVLVRVSGAPDGSDATPGRTDIAARSRGARPAGWDTLVEDVATDPSD